MISVVLGEPSEAARDAETLELLTWGLEQFKRVQVLDPARALARADVRYYDERIRLVPRRGAVLTLRAGERVRRRVRAPDELEGPLPAGRRAGVVTVLVEGQRCGGYLSSPRPMCPMRGRSGCSPRPWGSP